MSVSRPSRRCEGFFLRAALLTLVTLVPGCGDRTDSGASERTGAVEPEAVQVGPNDAPRETQGGALENQGFEEQPAWFKQSFLDVREDIDEAKAAGRRLALYFYQDGCPYCKKLLEVNFSSREITEKTRRYVDVVALNIWGDRDVVDLNGQTMPEKAFSRELNVNFTPTLVFFDEQGKSIARLNGYYPPHQFEAALDYVGLKKESEGSLGDYYRRHEPVPSSGRLHREAAWLQPPFDLSNRTSGKPLLVMFEQQDCKACDELHGEILQRDDSRGLLAGFDIALLDTWSSEAFRLPDGTQTTAMDWAHELGVQYLPTLVMFDVQGKEAFRTEAWLKAFHLQSALDYVLSGAYRDEPNFQRYIETRADALRARGVDVEIMN